MVWSPEDRLEAAGPDSNPCSVISSHVAGQLTKAPCCRMGIRVTAPPSQDC